MLVISMIQEKNALLIYGDIIIQRGDILIILTDESRLSSVKKRAKRSYPYAETILLK